MNKKGFLVSLSLSVFAVAFVAALPRQAIGDHGQGSAELKQHAGELVRAVREATRRFRDVDQAEAEGYQLLFGCVSGPDDGAMGLHYVNMELVIDAALDPRKPEIVIYEPLPNGGRTPDRGGLPRVRRRLACQQHRARRSSAGSSCI